MEAPFEWAESMRLSLYSRCGAMLTLACDVFASVSSRSRSIETGAIGCQEVFNIRREKSSIAARSARFLLFQYLLRPRRSFCSQDSLEDEHVGLLHYATTLQVTEKQWSTEAIGVVISIKTTTNYFFHRQYFETSTLALAG